MTKHAFARTAGKLALGGVGLGAAAYGAVVAYTWARYGRPAEAGPEAADWLLDRFMPEYEAVERHQIRVAAPAELALDIARRRDLLDSRLVRAIFEARQVILGGVPAAPRTPRGIVDECVALGWVVLAEEPRREIVLGAVTKPWEANPVFRSIPPAEFRTFSEPGYVKIVWTLRADPDGPDAAVFRTETRVATTDEEARKKFRTYWSFFAAGVWAIRRIGLAPLKKEAEARYCEAASAA